MNNFKKLMIAAISVLLCVSMVSCGNNKNDDENTTTTPAVTTPSESESTTTTAPTEEKATIIDPKVSDSTLGGKIWKAFLAAMEEKPETTAEEMANLLITNEAIQFGGAAVPLEAGQVYFNGFNNYQITGYKQGASFMPMIGSIPFIGYIFELEQGADVETFIKNLTDNADLRWNVCVTADQMVAGAYGTTVFFLMCPAS